MEALSPRTHTDKCPGVVETGGSMRNDALQRAEWANRGITEALWGGNPLKRGSLPRVASQLGLGN